jgi:signal transduction histidine kinase
MAAPCGLVVRDTGRGIAPEQLDSIFEPFVQAGQTSQRTASAAWGLGLAISRELARAMHGELTATSAPGREARSRSGSTAPERAA